MVDEFAAPCCLFFFFFFLFFEVLKIRSIPPPKTQEQWEKEQKAKEESIAKWREEQQIK
jgi:hypothetical protein